MTFKFWNDGRTKRIGFEMQNVVQKFLFCEGRSERTEMTAPVFDYTIKRNLVGLL